ncbi:MAG TPA: hypothetical protein VH230_08130, partial [Stellaceae bacterium]|nr:hypothetical protein [Stellaceae bacterium]
AQGGPPPSGPPSGAAGQPPGYAGGAAGQTAEPAPSTQSTPGSELPVLYVTSVEVMRTSTEPKLDIVRVTGLTGSQGWSAPQLVPTYVGKPLDGVLDLQFIATMPQQTQSAEGFVPISAVFPLEEGNLFKGVRVRASENAIEVKQMPGMNQAQINVNDCKDCIGKKFLERGQAQPGQQGVVRQEDLPKVLRWIVPSRGIRGITHNPNRLNLILGDDNTIIAAYWE